LRNRFDDEYISNKAEASPAAMTLSLRKGFAFPQILSTILRPCRRGEASKLIDQFPGKPEAFRKDGGKAAESKPLATLLCY
jgi:hypothetical protein